MIRSDYRSPQLRRYHRIAAENRAKGRTAHGDVRQRRAKLTAAARRQYGTAKFRRRTERLFALNLTTRGTKRRIRIGRTSLRMEVAARVQNAVLQAGIAKALANKRVAEILRSYVE